MTRQLPWLVALACLCSLPGTSSAQTTDPGSVRIRVTDAITGDPLEGARVGFPELSLFSLTDGSGTAVIRVVPPGGHAFEVTMVGYGAATGLLHLEPGAAADDRVALMVQPFEIEGITVDGRRRWSTTLQRSGFYERSKIGFGDQLDRVALRRRNPLTLDDAIEHLLRPGCRDGTDAGVRGGGATSFGNSGGPIATQTMGTARGAPVIFLDGIAWSGTTGDIPVDWVEGVEVYRSLGSIPARYAGWARCGVILVWTG